MPYITKDQYSLRIGVQHLTEILAQAIETTGLTEDQVRLNAETWAKGMINAFLKTRYDMVTEFAKDSTDVSREMLIVQTLIDLSLCTLHKTINPRDIPEHIQKGCDDAMAFLKDARDGLLILGLTKNVVASPDQNYPTSFISSQQKFISKPFTDASLIDQQ